MARYVGGLGARIVMWDTGNRPVAKNMDPSRLPEPRRERWTLRACTWADYSETERKAWREWFEWATAPGGELYDHAIGGARLSGMRLDDTDLSRMNLRGAQLDRAHLSRANLSQADLRGANLLNARLEGAICNRANFTDAELSGATLNKADLTACNLSSAQLHQNDLTAVDFRDALLFGTRITQPTWWVALPRPGAPGEILFQPGLPEHPVQDVLGLPPVLRRQLADVQYIRDMHRKASSAGRLLMWLWGITCLYGQSAIRWALFSAMVAVLFAFLYMAVPLSMPYHHLADDVDMIVAPEVARPDFGRALWLSISTLMTLGLGDEVPVTGFGRFIAAAEVILGYVMLGGLLSIFANKFARLS